MPMRSIVDIADVGRSIRELQADNRNPHTVRLIPGPYVQRLTAGDLTQTTDVPSNHAPTGEIDVLPEYHDPLMTSRQKRMLCCFETFGILGLVTLFKEMAHEDDRLDVSERGMVPKPATDQHVLTSKKRRQMEDPSRLSKKLKLSGGSDHTEITINDDDSENNIPKSYHLQGHVIWKRVVKDLDQGSRSVILYYLASLPEKMIRAIICGNVPLKMQDPQFRTEMAPIVKLKQSQGVYAVYVAVNNLDNDPGRGLTLRQLMEAISHMRTYCNIQCPDSAELAYRIDNQYGVYRSSPGYYRYQRRYGCGQARDEFGPIISWLDKLDDMILNGTKSPNHSLDIPMQRSLSYVGLSSTVSSRARDHCVHKNSSPLIGLFSATLKLLYKDRFDLQDHCYQLIHTVSSDHIGLDEVLIAMLSSSHWWDGGLNLGHTGTRTSLSLVSEMHESKMADKIQYYRDLGYQDSNVSAAIAKTKSKDLLLRHLSLSGSAEHVNITDQSIELLREALLCDEERRKLHALEQLDRIAALRVLQLQIAQNEA